jgi:proline dehydrogenase
MGVINKVVEVCGDRYVAGYSIPQGLDVIARIVDEGYFVSLDFLGENATSLETADLSLEKYHDVIDLVGERFEFGDFPNEVPVSISVKPSSICQVYEMGAFGHDGKGETIAFSLDTPLESRLREIVHATDQIGSVVTLDMEDHRYTDDSLNVVKSILAEDMRPGVLGNVLQSRLDRTLGDVGSLVADITDPGSLILPKGRPRARVCIGIYNEDANIATQSKKVAKQRLMRHVETLLKGGFYVEIATHDKNVIKTLQEEVLPKYSATQYEFQFLLGVPVAEHKLAPALRDLGETVRFYAPIQYQDGSGVLYMKRRLWENKGMVLSGMTTLGRSSMAKEHRKKLAA